MAALKGPNFFPNQHNERYGLDNKSNIDSAFPAVAAALIDKVGSLRSNKIYQSVLGKILERYKCYFTLPQAAGLLTPTERLCQLIINRSNEMEKLAYTLRQIAVNQLRDNLRRYILVFLEENKGSSLVNMRKFNTPVGNTTIAALADALSIPIIIYSALPRKDLHIKTEYGPISNNIFANALHIQLIDKLYIPKNSRVQPIHFTKQTIQPKEWLEKDFSLEEITTNINYERQYLRDSFQKNKRTLQYFMQDHNITKDQLRNIYIKQLGKINSTQYIGIEHGIEHFSAVILGNDRQMLKPTLSDNPVKLTHNDLLIDTLAWEISFGRLDENFVDDSLNQKTTHKQSFR